MPTINPRSFPSWFSRANALTPAARRTVPRLLRQNRKPEFGYRKEKAIDLLGGPAVQPVLSGGGSVEAPVPFVDPAPKNIDLLGGPAIAPGAGLGTAGGDDAFITPIETPRRLRAWTLDDLMRSANLANPVTVAPKSGTQTPIETEMLSSEVAGGEPEPTPTPGPSPTPWQHMPTPRSNDVVTPLQRLWDQFRRSVGGVYHGVEDWVRNNAPAGADPGEEAWAEPVTVRGRSPSSTPGSTQRNRTNISNPAWYMPGHRLPPGIQAAIDRGDYENPYGPDPSQIANAMLMASQQHGGNPNRVDAGDTFGQTRFTTGPGRRVGGRMVDGALMHVASGPADVDWSDTRPQSGRELQQTAAAAAAWLRRQRVRGGGG